MSREAWLELLQKNPWDPVLWGQELERLNGMRELIATSKSSNEDFSREMALANNDQLRGIALRHLKRYPEGLAALAASDKSLAATWAARQCATQGATDACRAVGHLRSLTFLYIASIHQDTDDAAQLSAALKNALMLSRGTDRYQQLLPESMQRLMLLDDFANATSLLVDEIGYVAQTGDGQLVKFIEGIGASYSLALYYGISWLPDGSVRDADPRDFVDNTGIGIDRPVKYGMTDRQEDHATFGTAIIMEEILAADADDKAKEHDLLQMAKESGYSSIEELIRNSYLKDYVRAEMLDGNFEPLAKYLLFERLSLSFTLRPDKDFDCLTLASEFPFPFTEIRRRLREVPAGTIRPTTRDILFSTQLLFETVVANCRKEA